MKHEYMNVYTATKYIDQLYVLFPYKYAFEMAVLLLSKWLNDEVIDVDDHAFLRSYNRDCRKAMEV